MDESVMNNANLLQFSFKINEKNELFDLEKFSEVPKPELDNQQIVFSLINKLSKVKPLTEGDVIQLVQGLSDIQQTFGDEFDNMFRNIISWQDQIWMMLWT